MTAPQDLVFLFDVDNTLIDNDRFEDDLRRHLVEQFGRKTAEHYWIILEKLRTELGYADYLGALQRYRIDLLSDPALFHLSSFLLDYPFKDRVYPGAFDALAHMQRLGTTVVLSDGDAVFQPRKIQHSGVWDAVQGRALVYIHKEKMLDAVAARYRARHYIAVDDKLRILAAMKQVLGDRLTTVFPRQGHYAHDPKNIRLYPSADITIEHIGDLSDVDLTTLAPAWKADASARSN